MIFFVPDGNALGAAAGSPMDLGSPPSEINSADPESADPEERLSFFVMAFMDALDFKSNKYFRELFGEKFSLAKLILGETYREPTRLYHKRRKTEKADE